MSMNKYAEMELHRGDIIWYCKEENETIGSEQYGTRPAIIVSNDIANFYSPIVLVVPLTSRSKAEQPTHATIIMGEHKSVALCEQVTSISVKRIISKIGYVSPKQMKSVSNALKVALFL